MVVDFQEVLEVIPHDDREPVLFYDYLWTKEDLASEEVSVKDFGECVSLGEICSKIEDFGGSQLTIKQKIRHFLENDTIYLTDEY